MNPQIIGIGASVLSAISMLPQLIKVFKEKDSENVSIGMLCILIAGLSSWIWYGVMIKDPIIIWSNCFSVTLNVVLLICAFRYK